MMRVLSVFGLAAALALASMPTQALELPRVDTSSVVTKVSAPPNHQLKFGKRVQKHQSLPQTSWVCFTPGGSCHVPGLGFCYCCFPWGCYNGHT